MQNKENYSKITFKDGEQIILQNYQVKNDKMILCKYNNSELKNIQIGGTEYLEKTYEYFNKWVTEDTLKSITYVPMESTTLIAEKKTFVLKTNREYIINTLVDYIDIPVIFESNDAVFYVKNAYSRNAPVKLLLPTIGDFKVYDVKVLRVRIYNIPNLINTNLSISLDIYRDISRMNKIGMIDFDFKIISSYNPSGD